MSTWIGTLARGGVLRDLHEEAGIAVAALVVGEERLSELRAWMAAQPGDVVEREQRGAIEVCIWMAHADREVDPGEKDLLRRVILASALDQEAREALVRASDEPPSLAGIERRVTHPVLRELLLALSWELASADGTLDGRERDFHLGLARRLGVAEERLEEIRDAVTQRLSAAPG